LSQAAATHLCAAHGVIVNIADLAAFETWPAYLRTGSRVGVVHARSLARILAPDVRVAGIAPGAVLLPEKWDPEAVEHLRQTTPLQRICCGCCSDGEERPSQ
jgi:pteridine reductase